MNSDHFCQIEYLPKNNGINNYDNIAQIYDLIMGDDIAQILIDLSSPVILKHIKKEHFKILDLACGSGAYIYYFNKNFNSHSYGIDLSIGQIEIAKEKCKDLDVTFIQGDLIATPFPENCDIITINLDALNHITKINDWICLFDKVNKSLIKGGLFLFDINSRKRLLYDWNSPEVIIKRNLTYVQCGLKPQLEANLVRRKILMLIFQEIDNQIRKYSATIEQVSVYKKDIIRYLRKANFRKVNEYYKCDSHHLKHIFLKNRYFFYAIK